MSKRGDTSPITPVKDKSFLIKNRFSIQLNFGNLFSTDKMFIFFIPRHPIGGSKATHEKYGTAYQETWSYKKLMENSKMNSIISNWALRKKARLTLPKTCTNISPLALSTFCVKPFLCANAACIFLFCCTRPYSLVFLVIVATVVNSTT